MTEEQLELARQLQEISGYGMMDCKKVLVTSNFDMNVALTYLQKYADIGKLTDYWIDGRHVSKEEYYAKRSQ